MHDSSGNPVKQVVVDQAFTGGPRYELPDRAERIAHRQKRRADANYVHRRIRKALANKQHDRRAHEWKQRDQPDMRKKIFRRHHSVRFLQAPARRAMALNSELSTTALPCFHWSLVTS